MVSIGIIGLGFMGMTHYRGIRNVRGGKVAAICTRSPKKRVGDWRGLGGNFGEPGGVEDLSGIRTYEKIDDLLSDASIDLVDICLPTSQHCEVAIAAMRAGKHVLAEKPIALSLEDADHMVRISEQTGRLMMVAQVLPFSPSLPISSRWLMAGNMAMCSARILNALFRSRIGRRLLPIWKRAGGRASICIFTIRIIFWWCSVGQIGWCLRAGWCKIGMWNIFRRVINTTASRICA